jgi:hypothetical protein
MILRAAFFVLFSILPMALSADVLFEGWFEVFLGDSKVGYFVERYEFTDKKFKSTYYLKTNSEGSSITESLKAFAASDLTPISYSYTSKMADDIKIIDATFKGQVMTLKTNDGKKEKKETKKIKKGTFLSTFLLYLILQQKDGLTEGKDYNYYAIAEEEGVAYTGEAKIANLEKVKGRDAYKILNKFKGEKFFTWVSPKGEILLTRSSDKNIDVRFAGNMTEATKGMIVNHSDLQLLFGNKIPGEAENVEEKKKKLFEKKEVKPAGKGAGVPGGQGILIKGVPPPTASPEPTAAASPSGQ